jgi:hypothetical protein
MTRVVALAFVIACGGARPSTPGPTTATECAPTDCGPEPPISPHACPPQQAVSSVCRRARSGACERRVLCDGQETPEIAPPVAEP